MTIKRKNKKYTTEFKQQMVSLYQSGKSALDIAREYGISDKSIYQWVRQTNTSCSFKVSDNCTPEENELRKLQKENQQLRMENDILKQATLIMGRK